jgi:hypothetical protein
MTSALMMAVSLRLKPSSGMEFPRDFRIYEKAGRSDPGGN